MALEFFHVQIPYRGVVPVINRRGPFADIQLTREQIDLLMNEFKVEVLDPRTGKEFHYPKPAGGIEPAALAAAASMPEPADAEVADPEHNLPSKADDVPGPDEDDGEDSGEPLTHEQLGLSGQEQTEPAPPAEPSKADDVEGDEPGDDPVSEAVVTAGIPEFDHTQFPNYSSFTKPVKKQLRAEYAEAVSKGMDPAEFYAKKKAEMATTGGGAVS